MSLLFGTVWLRLGDSAIDAYLYSSLFNVVNILCVVGAFVAIPGVMVDRGVFYRQVCGACGMCVVCRGRLSY